MKPAPGRLMNSAKLSPETHRKRRRAPSVSARRASPRFLHLVGYLLLLAVDLWPALGLATDIAVAKRSAWTTSRVHGSPEPPAPYQIAPAFGQLRFQRPTSIEELPGENRLLVTEMSGKIFTFPQDQPATQADLLIDLAASLAGQGVSLFDAEPHPDFRRNRQLFVCYVHPQGGGETRVSRFTLDSRSPPAVLPGSEQVVITWPSGGHNGGCLEFGTDGFLYISTGDGAGPNPPDGLTTGQDVSDLLGAILRIDVDHPTAERAYAIPADNPFVGVEGPRPEIWAYGLRNPWKFGVDRQSGEIFVADNGWESWEMVHRLQRGGNCGWPVMEGRVALRTEVKPGPTPIVPPVKDHPHTEANSVIGGPVYRGRKLPGLNGSFVYGDYITGTIWAIRPDEDNSYSHTTLVDTDLRIVAFTEASDGELYVLDHDFTGQIYRLLPSDVPDTSATFPRRLSETGLFSALDDMRPAPGVVPYRVQVPRWMDGAKSRRWIAVPDSGTVELAAEGKKAVYPDGTVLVNHATLPQGDGSDLRLETQLLHFERGAWHPYSYLWDEAGREAWLVESTGANRSIRASDPSASERTWHVNAVNECKVCHNAESGYVLGFVANQLNLPLDRETDQLALLAGQGVLAAAPTVAEDDPSRLVDPHDPTKAVDDRARSYLHVNCGVCHRPGGNAIVSFYLRRDLPFAQLNTNKGTGIGTFGIGGGRIIAQGDPYRSLLLYRMSKLGYARMPYIGSRVVDGSAVPLIEEWIRSLPKIEDEKTSALANPLSPESTALQSLAQKSLPAGEREAAVGTLLQSTEGALALAVQMHRSLLAGDDLAAALSLAAASPKSEIRGLFETFIPESKRRATLGAGVDPQVILDRRGDHDRGKLIFFSDGARCRACHELDDRTKSLGPTLAEINKKYPRLDELLSHVLRPSQKVEDAFAAYTLVRSDGTIVTGLAVEQSEKRVVLRTVEKQTIAVAREDIEELRRSEKSLMPEGVLSDLTAQEAADLFEYIRSAGGGS
ncbi:MAG TPA: PQQ-dependent sugar dehydrogenase [Pirellulales bacterium]|nr:PQQ-dependent sugar dehydrogenase [Pirellulales bacterium]